MASYAASRQQGPPDKSHHHHHLSVLAQAKPAIIGQSQPSVATGALSEKINSVLSLSTHTKNVSQLLKHIEDDNIIRKQNASNQMRQTAVMAAVASQQKVRLSASERLAMTAKRPSSSSSTNGHSNNESTRPEATLAKCGSADDKASSPRPFPAAPPLTSGQPQARKPVVNPKPASMPTLETLLAVQRQLQQHTKQNLISPATKPRPQPDQEMVRDAKVAASHLSGVRASTIASVTINNDDGSSYSSPSAATATFTSTPSSASNRLAAESPGQRHKPLPPSPPKSPTPVDDGAKKVLPQAETYDRDLPPLPQSAESSSDESQFTSLESQQSSSPATSLVSIPPPPPPLSSSYLDQYDQVNNSAQSRLDSSQESDHHHHHHHHHHHQQHHHYQPSNGAETSSSSSTPSTPSTIMSEIPATKQHTQLNQQQQLQVDRDLEQSGCARQTFSFEPPLPYRHQMQSFDSNWTAGLADNSSSPSLANNNTQNAHQYNNNGQPEKESHQGFQSTLTNENTLHVGRSLGQQQQPPSQSAHLNLHQANSAAQHLNLHTRLNSQPAAVGYQQQRSPTTQGAGGDHQARPPALRLAHLGHIHQQPPPPPLEPCKAQANYQHHSLPPPPAPNMPPLPPVSFKLPPPPPPSSATSATAAAATTTTTTTTTTTLATSSLRSEATPTTPVLTAAPIVSGSLIGLGDRSTPACGSLNAAAAAAIPTSTSRETNSAAHQSDGGSFRFPTPPPPCLLMDGFEGATGAAGNWPRLNSRDEGDEDAAENNNNNNDDDDFQCRIPTPPPHKAMSTASFQTLNGSLHHQLHNSPVAEFGRNIRLDQQQQQQAHQHRQPSTGDGQQTASVVPPPPLFRQQSQSYQPLASGAMGAANSSPTISQTGATATTAARQPPPQLTVHIGSTTDARLAHHNQHHYQPELQLQRTCGGHLNQSAINHGHLSQQQQHHQQHHHHHQMMMMAAMAESSSSPSSSSDGDGHSSNSSSSTSGIHSSIDSPSSSSSNSKLDDFNYSSLAGCGGRKNLAPTTTTTTKPPISGLHFRKSSMSAPTSNLAPVNQQQVRLHLAEAPPAAPLLPSVELLNGSNINNNINNINNNNKPTAKLGPPLLVAGVTGTATKSRNSTLAAAVDCKNTTSTTSAANIRPPRPALKQKKSVSFSDQVELVACAEEECKEILPNPLLARVLAAKLH